MCEKGEVLTLAFKQVKTLVRATNGPNFWEKEGWSRFHFWGRVYAEITYSHEKVSTFVKYFNFFLCVHEEDGPDMLMTLQLRVKN